MNDSTSTQSVVIERTLRAPIALVWQMWTEAEHFAAWYGPMGAKVPTATMDVEPGGRRFIAMVMERPDGVMQMWFTGEYVEIEPPTRLVYTEAMADADGKPLSPEAMGMPPGAPMETRVIVELVDLGGATRMTVTHEGVPADSPGAQGWQMALDKLEAHLAG